MFTPPPNPDAPQSVPMPSNFRFYPVKLPGGDPYVILGVYLPNTQTHVWIPVSHVDAFVERLQEQARIARAGLEVVRQVPPNVN